MQNEWARSSDWSVEGQGLFEAKLRRARSMRPQYLHMKGMALEATGDSELLEAAADLFQRALDDPHATDGDRLLARQRLASLAARRGEFDQAERLLRDCVSFEKGGLVGAYSVLALAELLASSEREEHLHEGLELLVEFAPNAIWPREQFRLFVAKAHIDEKMGNRELARLDAERALGVLSRNESLDRHHPEVGQVETDEATVRELERMAAL